MAAPAALCGMDFGSAFALFERDYAPTMGRRQRDCLRHLATLNEAGYWLSDLPDVRRLLRLAMDRLKRGSHGLAPALVDVLRLLAHPPRTAKANEEVVYSGAIRGALHILGEALRAGEPRVELAAGETLLGFARAVPAAGEIRMPGDSRPTRWNTNHDLLRKSGAIELVAAAFASEVAELQEADVDGDGSVDMGEFYRFRMLNDGTTDNDDDQKESALLAARGNGTARHAEAARDAGAGGGTADGDAGDGPESDDEDPGTTWTSSEQFLDVAARLVRELSEHPDGAAALTACGTPLACLEVLRLVASHREPIVGTCLETLWNLCEHSALALTRGVALSLPQLLRKHRAANAAHVLASGAALGVLRSLFSRAVQEGSSTVDRALRNEAVVVATVLARTPSPPIDAPPDGADEAEAHGSASRDGPRPAVPRPTLTAATPRDAAGLPSHRAAHDAAAQGTTPAVAALLSSGMLEEALLYACAAELDVPTPAARRHFASHTEPDLELKALLWELASSAVRAEQDHRQSLRAFARLRRVKDKRQLGAPRFWSRSELMRVQETRETAEATAAADRAAAARRAAAAESRAPGTDGELGAREAERASREEEERVAAEEARREEEEERAMLVDWAPGGPALRAVQSSALIPALLAYVNPVDDAGSADPVVRALAGVDGAPEDGHGSEADDAPRPPDLPPHPFVSRWSADQKRRIELHALSVLRLLAPLCLPAVVDADGCFVLALYLRAHSAALRRRHGADEVAVKAAADAARSASYTGRPAAVTAMASAGAAGGGAFSGDDASRQYCTLRLIAALCSAPRGGAAVSAELGALGLVGDVVELLRAAESAATSAAGPGGGQTGPGAATAGMGLALSQPPGALRSAGGGGSGGGSAAAGGGDGAASPESGGAVPLGRLVEAACAALTALCGGCGSPRRALTTAEHDEDEQTGAAETDGVREALDEAERAAQQAQTAGRAGAGAGAGALAHMPSSARALSARGSSAVEADDAADTVAPRRGGAAGAGRAVFRPNQKALRAAGGLRLALRWLKRLSATQRAELAARDREAEAAAPRLAAARGRRSHLDAMGAPSSVLPARSALGKLGEEDAMAMSGPGAEIAAGAAALARGESRPGTAAATLLQRTSTASGFSMGPGATGKGGASVAAGTMQRASTPLDGPPDSEAQLGAAVVAAVWAAVSGSSRAVARAVDAGVVDCLLDWLEVCPTRERAAVLGTLADVAAEPVSRAHFRAWRSAVDGGGAASLLMRVWCEDEARLGVRHGPRGEIADLLRPLEGSGGAGDDDDDQDDGDGGGVTGAFGRLREALRAAKMWDSVEGQQAGADKDADAVGASAVVTTRGGGLPSIAALVSGGDLRPKVWAVLSALGWDAVESGIAGDVGSLPLTFRVALVLARALPEAKRGAAWAELDREMRGESLPPSLRAVPVAEDMATIDEATREATEASLAFRAIQRRVAQATDDAEATQGRSFMQSVVDTRHAIEESVRLASRRRAMPQDLSFEERKHAREQKKAMLAKQQASQPGADSAEDSLEDAGAADEAEGKRAAAYHPMHDWEVGARDDTDSDDE